MSTKSNKLTLDFSDVPGLIERLRMLAAQDGTTQKSIVVRALEAFFADRIENDLLLRAANQAFVEWDNKEDAVYDTL